jgi:hypothetical protein
MNRNRTTSALAFVLSSLALGASAAPLNPWQSEGGHAEAAGENGDPGAAKAKSANKSHAFGKLRQILKSEPTCKEVQDATLRFYKLEPERIRKMATASRIKSLVPELEGSIDNSVGHTYTNTQDGLYPSQSLINAGRPASDPINGPSDNPFGYKERVTTSTDNLLWRVRAVWNLDRLVFNSEELDVKSLNSLEENLVREVTTLYYQRHRLIANLILSGPEEDEEIFYELLRLDEQTSTLDALTGGFFGQKAWKWESEVKW